jgi:hypothetical protein
MDSSVVIDGASTSTPVCGLIMPISSIDGCDEGHWKDVQEILSSAIKSAGYEANLVSNDTDVGVIHKRIVQNLYNNPLIVCDVSGKNPNVMFELGMRLAFDKPVIIVKDDKTPYSFDTSPVEHLTYPRDLRFGMINGFQTKLQEKIRNNSARKNSFLGSFGTFKVAEIQEERVGALDVILEELTSMKTAMRRMDERYSRRYKDSISSNIDNIEANFSNVALLISGQEENRARLSGSIKAMNGVIMVERTLVGDSKEIFSIFFNANISLDRLIVTVTDTAQGLGCKVRQA